MRRDKAKVTEQRQITEGLIVQVKELGPYVKITRDHSKILSKDISWSDFPIRKFLLATGKYGLKEGNTGDNLSLVHILHLHKYLHIIYEV